MILTLLKSKLHKATVTEADLHYHGSISIDQEICRQANLLINEKVDIYNINNGMRFSTYIIAGKKGEICLNGAAARMAQKGDRVIIASYAQMEEQEAAKWKPTVLFLDEKNEVIDKK